MPVNIPFGPGLAVGGGGGGSAVGTGLGAISRAIEMYLKMQQQDEENAIARKKVEIDEQQADALGKYYQAQGENFERLNTDSERKGLQALFDNYGGQRATPETVTQAQKLGMTQGLDPEMTPASRSMIGYAGMPGPDQSVANAGGGMQPQAVAPQSTGNYNIVPTEPTKYRVALEQATAAGARNAATIAGANSRNDANIASRERVAQARIGNAVNNTALRLQMQKYGIDIADRRNQALLQAAFMRDAAQTDDRTFDNMLNIFDNPMGLLGLMQGGSKLPTPPPNYYRPEAGGGAPSPNLGDPFVEVK